MKDDSEGERRLRDIAHEHGWRFRTETPKGEFGARSRTGTGRDYVFSRDDVVLMFNRRGYGHAEARIAGHVVRLAGSGIGREDREAAGGLPDVKTDREVFAVGLLRWYSPERVYAILIERLEQMEKYAREAHEKASAAVVTARRAFARREFVIAKRAVFATAATAPEYPGLVERLRAATTALEAVGVEPSSVSLTEESVR
jgi:hypothetical protein